MSGFGLAGPQSSKLTQLTCGYQGQAANEHRICRSTDGYSSGHISTFENVKILYLNILETNLDRFGRQTFSLSCRQMRSSSGLAAFSFKGRKPNCSKEIEHLHRLTKFLSSRRSLRYAPPTRFPGSLAVQTLSEEIDIWSSVIACGHCVRRRSFHKATLKKERDCFAATFRAWKMATLFPLSRLLRNSPPPLKSRCIDSSMTARSLPNCRISRSEGQPTILHGGARARMHAS